MSSKFHERARVGALSRSRPNDDPELVEARQNLAEAKIAAYVQEVLDTAPELRDDQRVKLAELLKPVRVKGSGDAAPMNRQAAVEAALAELDGGGADVA